MLSFNLIVALDAKNGIGIQGQLPWHLPSDLKHFKDITVGEDPKQKKNVVIMGRKTWDSIPERFRPLTERLNIVLTRNKNLNYPDDVLKAESFVEAFKILENPSLKEVIGSVYVIGGQSIFEQSIHYPQCQKIYVTYICKEFECDAFFPAFDHIFRKKYSSPILHEGSLSYYFAEYIKADEPK